MGSAKVERTDSITTADSRSAWPRRLLRWAWAMVRATLQLLLIGWGTLAIYFPNLPSAWMRVALALTFAAFAVWALWLSGRPKMRWAFAGAMVGVVAWF